MNQHTFQISIISVLASIMLSDINNNLLFAIIVQMYVIVQYIK